MRFVNEGHLGGFVAADKQYPNGDPMTYTPKVWQFLKDSYNPLTIVDVGCGQGHAVKWFLDHRNTFEKFWAVGVEGCDEAIRTSVVPASSFKLATLWKHDFSEKAMGAKELGLTQVDLAYSCEFVEHIEEQHVNNFLSLFQLAKVVAMTHAFPGQPGHHHVNCRSTDYWVDKMKQIGFDLEPLATLKSREIAEPSHWKRSGLIFLKVA